MKHAASENMHTRNPWNILSHWRRLVCLLVAQTSVLAASGLNPVTLKESPRHDPIPLVTDGQVQVTLCLMEMAPGIPSNLAVEELKSSFKAIFGVELPVVKNRIVDGPVIVAGGCEEAKAAGLDGSQLPVEGFAIKTAANRIYIVGRDDASLRSYGTAWGIYEFLERVLDVRWYWPAQHGGRSLTARASQSMDPLWIEDAPVYRKREIWPSHLPGLIGLHTALRSGNSWPIDLNVHAPHKWGAIFKESQPEIFQLSKGGKRDDIMLCYGNAQTIETYLAVIDRHMRGEAQPPEAAQIIKGTAITVSPWDVNVACYCDDCRALWNEEGGAYGNASLVLESFVKKLADEVKKRWPSMVVIYLPYLNYTMATGKVKFPDNVEVQLCGMPGLALYKEPSVNALFQGNIDLWRSLTKRPVQTWEYSCWPEDRIKAPYHYPHVLKAYYQHNRGKLVGSFINGVTDHWPRSNFSLYCWMKLLWNPDFDVDAAADEYCARLFGPAAEPMRQLLTIQSDRWEKVSYPDGNLAAQSVYTLSFPKPVIDRMRALLAEAQELAAGDPLTEQRLAYYKTPFPEFYREFEYVIEGKGMAPLRIKKAGELPVVDGKLDDHVWQSAEAVPFKVYGGPEEGSQPAKFPTDLKAVWTPEGVAFGFRMSEPNPAALQKEKSGQDDGALYWQDCVELFIDPTGTNEGNYFHFLLTAGLARFDARKDDTTWTCEGLDFQTFVGEDFWSMEVVIPTSAIGATLTTGSTGVTWFGQFTRHRMADSVGGNENQKMNANQGGFNSNTGDFGELRFEE